MLQNLNPHIKVHKAQLHSTCNKMLVSLPLNQMAILHIINVLMSYINDLKHLFNSLINIISFQSHIIKRILNIILSFIKKNSK